MKEETKDNTQEEEIEPASKGVVFLFCFMLLTKGITACIFQTTTYFFMLRIMDGKIEQANYLYTTLSTVKAITKFIGVFICGLAIDSQKMKLRTIMQIFTTFHTLGFIFSFFPNIHLLFIGNIFREFGAGYIIVVKVKLTFSKKQSSFALVCTVFAKIMGIIAGSLLSIFVIPKVEFKIGNFDVWYGNFPCLVSFTLYFVILILCSNLMTDNDDPIQILKRINKRKKEKSFWRNGFELCKNIAYLVILMFSIYFYMVVEAYKNYRSINYLHCYGFGVQWLGAMLLVAYTAKLFFMPAFKIINDHWQKIDFMVVIILPYLAFGLSQTTVGSLFCDSYLLSDMYVKMMFTAGYQIPPVLLIAKLVDNKMKGTAQSLCSMCQKLSAIIIGALGTIFVNHQEPFMFCLMLIGVFLVAMAIWKRQLFVNL
eukprot:TCONS_00007455-protein